MPWTDVIKLFTAVIYKWAKTARVFVLCKSFHPRLMFLSKVGTYLSGAPFRKADGIICKDKPRLERLAKYEHSSIFSPFNIHK